MILPTNQALANEDTETVSEPAVDIRAVELNKGETAPFTGQLITEDLAIIIGQKADNCDGVIKTKTDHLAGLCKVKVDGLERKHSVEKKALEDKLEATTKTLESVQGNIEVPFWENPYLLGVGGLVIGTVVGAGVVLAVLFTTNEVQK